MLLTTKHENLSQNIFVLGADVLSVLKKKPMGTDLLFSEIKKLKNIDLNSFLDALTFLYITDVIKSDNRYIKINQ